ncbi:MAG TPA: NAD(P)/FAD-dependent oxidoreductase [Bacteroidales bacterium]|jgi:protoporphyrinogen oxidase|nr:NAD(P)/FAD-dependent oxidoreductase [Bacteroidales bacterium]
MPKTAIIIGAGPAGLTAAYELIQRTDIKPIILEQTSDIGGISKTVNYKGNRMDIGGHRFFSKSDVVMKWWQDIMPIQGSLSKDEILKEIHFKKKFTKLKLSPNGPDPEVTDGVMLIRNRLSRIFYLKKFFDYPVTLNGNTISNLGIVRIIRIGLSYIHIKIKPPKNIITLEDFLISRFGKELYKTFFKDYTEKVWGVPCTEIAADWGAQRIKELSVSRAIIHALKSIFTKETSIEQKNTDTSLIEQFMYPKLGPGQMWETVANIIKEKGGIIINNAKVIGLSIMDNKINEVIYIDNETNNESSFQGDYYFSTMAVKDLIAAMGDTVPPDIKRVSDGLQYRDFITVGLLLNNLKIKNKTSILTLYDLVPDNWIYIQEREVKVGRLQIFNNWSPYMVSDLKKVWIGLEYFCNEGDDLWSMSDKDFIQFAIDELHKIDIIDKNEVIDSTIIRMPKTYPAYFGTYSEFELIKDFTDSFQNLFLIGRNGMHRYNNQDHSMLTAIASVNNIISHENSKSNIWSINTEGEYHEKK